MTAGCAIDVITERRDPAEVVALGGVTERYELARTAVATGVADGGLLGWLAHSAARVQGEAEESALGDAWTALTAFFTQTRTIDRARSRVRLRWPLFLLGCPDAAGAETEVRFATTETQAAGWRLKLFGTGFEYRTTIAVTDSHGAIAGPGARRLVFLEHDADLVEFAVERRGERIASGRRIELAGAAPTIGVADLPRLPARLPAWAAGSRSVQALRYAGAHPDTRQSWQHAQSFDTDHGCVLGVELESFEAGHTLDYQLSGSVELRAELPGGADWDVRTPEACPGMLIRRAGEAGDR